MLAYGPFTSRPPIRTSVIPRESWSFFTRVVIGLRTLGHVDWLDEWVARTQCMVPCRGIRERPTLQNRYGPSINPPTLLQDSSNPRSQ